jgi:hypothetical protein
MSQKIDDLQRFYAQRVARMGEALPEQATMPAEAPGQKPEELVIPSSSPMSKEQVRVKIPSNPAD